MMTVSLPLPLLALGVTAFTVGTTEYVVAGLLPAIATDLGVSIPTAGLLISGYAIGVAIGGPILAIVRRAGLILPPLLLDELAQSSRL